MLHGAGGGGWEWAIWARVFAASGFRVATPDLQPGAQGLAATHLDDYLHQARAALDALPRPRVVVGASLGGLLALAIADAADALVLVNPLPPAPWHALLPPPPAPTPSIVAWRARARLEGTRVAMPDAGPGDALHAFRRWRDESGAVLDAARAGLRIDLPKCPSLVLVSIADDDVPASASEALAHAMAAETMTLEHASHVGPLCGRDAASIAARVVTWLNVKNG
jgi:pimeloyl-ACP methyl ester carboxylesterase